MNPVHALPPFSHKIHSNVIIFRCQTISKESVQFRGPGFLRRGDVSPSSNCQAGEPSLVGCPLLLIQYNLSKGEGNVFPVLLTEHTAMKTYWASGVFIAPCILHLDTTWRWVVSFTPRPLYPQGKSLWYPLDRSLSGPQSRSGRGDEEKNSQHISEYFKMSLCPLLGCKMSRWCQQVIPRFQHRAVTL
jgi:hypothetical protein